MLITLALIAGVGAVAVSAADFTRRRRRVGRGGTPPLGDVRQPGAVDALATEPPPDGAAPEAAQAVDNAIDLQDIDRKLALALGSTVAAGAGALVAPAFGLLSVAGIIYLSRDLAAGLFDELRRRHRPSIDGLVLVIVGVCLAKGMLFVCSLNMAMAMVSRRLSAATRQRSEADLLQAFDQQLTAVRILRDGEPTTVDLLDVAVGDEVVVCAGEMVPVDGLVVRGAASIDQQALTGEAQPVERGAGEPVFAMTWLVAGELVIRVEHAGTDTVAGEISRVLRRAMRQRTPSEIRAQEVGNRSVLPTVAASIAVSPWVGPTGGLAILQAHPKYKTLIASHFGLLTTMGALARDGILVKDACALERLVDVDTFVFDKTGTLTLADLTVLAVHTEPGIDGRDLLRQVAALEAHQAHPIARAIIAAAQGLAFAIPPLEDAAVELGFGLSGVVGGRRLFVGSVRFMEQEGISISPALADLTARCELEGHATVLVGADGRTLGGVELQVTLRPEARAVVGILREDFGCQVYICSGDREPATRRLAEHLGADGHFSEMLPRQKAALIERLQSEGRTVCFVGDGINDTVALEAAAVSVSLAGASSVARDVASVVLLNDRLDGLTRLVQQAAREEVRTSTSTGLVLAPHLVGLSGVFFHGLGFVPMMFISQVGLVLGMSYMWRTREQGDWAHASVASADPGQAVGRDAVRFLSVSDVAEEATDDGPSVDALPLGEMTPGGGSRKRPLVSTG